MAKSVFIGAVTGFSKITEMTTEDIVTEISTLTLTDSKIIKNALDTPEEAMRIASKVRSNTRKRTIAIAASLAFGMAAFVARADMERINREAAELAQLERELLVTSLRNGEKKELPKPDMAKTAEQLIRTVGPNIVLLGLAFGAFAVSGYYRGRNDIIRSDLRELSNAAQNTAMRESMERLNATLLKLAPKGDQQPAARF